MILRAMSVAHYSISEGKTEDDNVGTTTLIGGVAFPLEVQKNHKQLEFGLVFGSVGDCKIFSYNEESQTVTDMTFDSREGSLSESDCGGRLGPFLDGHKPDLRNLSLKYVEVLENDLLFLVSDGVHDNLEPYQLGIAPKELDLNVKEWSELPDRGEEVKAKYRVNLLKKIIQSVPEQNRNPKELTAAVLEHCLQTNQKSTNWMVANPTKRIPTNYLEYPGKMDHTTCVCIRVGGK